MATGNQESENAMLQARLDKRRADALANANFPRIRPPVGMRRQFEIEDDSPIASRELTLEVEFTLEEKDRFKTDDELLRFLKNNGYNIQKINGCYSTGKGSFALTSPTQVYKNNLETFLRAKLAGKAAVITWVNDLYAKPQGKIVHVYNVPLEMPNNFFYDFFEKYGTIKRFWSGSHSGFRHIYNGAIHILYEDLDKHIPFYVDLGCTRVKVKYEGQNEDMICTNCQERGHYRSKCVNPPRCERCNEVGHTKANFLCYQNANLSEENYEDHQAGSEKTQNGDAIKENTQGLDRVEGGPTDPQDGSKTPPGVRDQDTPHPDTAVDKSEKTVDHPAGDQPGAGAQDTSEVFSPNAETEKDQFREGTPVDVEMSPPVVGPEGDHQMSYAEAAKSPAKSPVSNSFKKVFKKISPLRKSPNSRVSPRNVSKISVEESVDLPSVSETPQTSSPIPMSDLTKSPPKVQRKIPVKITSKIKAPSPLKGQPQSKSPKSLIIDEGSKGELDNSLNISISTPKTPSPVLSKNGSPLISINDKRSIFYDIGSSVNTVSQYKPPQTLKSFEYIAEARENILGKATRRRNSDSRAKPYSSPSRVGSDKETPGRPKK